MLGISYSGQIVFFQFLHYTCFSSAICPLQVLHFFAGAALLGTTDLEGAKFIYFFKSTFLQNRKLELQVKITVLLFCMFGYNIGYTVVSR